MGNFFRGFRSTQDKGGIYRSYFSDVTIKAGEANNVRLYYSEPQFSDSGLIPTSCIIKPTLLVYLTVSRLEKILALLLVVHLQATMSPKLTALRVKLFLSMIRLTSTSMPAAAHRTTSKATPTSAATPPATLWNYGNLPLLKNN